MRASDRSDQAKTDKSDQNRTTNFNSHSTLVILFFFHFPNHFLYIFCFPNEFSLVFNRHRLRLYYFPYKRVEVETWKQNTLRTLKKFKKKIYIKKIFENKRPEKKNYIKKSVKSLNFINKKKNIKEKSKFSVSKKWA